jgi:hypothetical protein
MQLAVSDTKIAVGLDREEDDTSGMPGKSEHCSPGKLKSASSYARNLLDNIASKPGKGQSSTSDSLLVVIFQYSIRSIGSIDFV